jgi:multisubunit Na+/H+ antiporter MnhG subunit
MEQRIIPLALVLAVIAAQLRFYIATGLAFVCVTAFGIATIPDPATEAIRRRKAQGTASFTTVMLAVFIMIAVLLTENFLIWVVSATFPDGQIVTTAPPPLQDNGQQVLRYAVADLNRRQVVGLRRLWNTQWALVACLGASFVVVELFHPSRTLYSLGTHAVLTVAAARSIRTISFLMTVLPSQVRNCYAQRFPYPPPDDIWEWIWVGMLPRAHGGCNDL